VSREQHRYRIEDEILRAGAVSYNMKLPETTALVDVILPNEQILGIVWGRYRQLMMGEFSGRGALVATNERIILVDKKPLFFKENEMPYGKVNGVNLSWVGLSGTVTLYLSQGKINLRTFNRNCALGFVAAVKDKLIKEEIYE
jgi:hypothetical protein